MDRLDVVVVGAGVIGLAIARALSLSGRHVVVLEAESTVGLHCSSRNSGVIHAGLYYPHGSLKARLCLQGKKLLYRYCEDRDIRYDRIGKLIVATTVEELSILAGIKALATANGVTDLQQLDAGETNRREPGVRCAGALFSPSTGIIDPGDLMLSLRGDVEAEGGSVVFDSRVSDVEVKESGIQFLVDNDEYVCRSMVNAASLWSIDLVRKAVTADLLPTNHFAIGHYYSLTGKSPFRHLVYPVPSNGGLGIHATNDLGGAVRFGPDVSWTKSIEYKFDISRKHDFVTAIQKYFPSLDADRLQPAYTGIRPKLSGPAQAAGDFIIQTESNHGARGLVNLFGIESPGLTAALAIADYVSARI